MSFLLLCYGLSLVCAAPPDQEDKQQLSEELVRHISDLLSRGDFWMFLLDTVSNRMRRFRQVQDPEFVNAVGGVKSSEQEILNVFEGIVESGQISKREMNVLMELLSSSFGSKGEKTPHWHYLDSIVGVMRKVQSLSLKESYKSSLLVQLQPPKLFFNQLVLILKQLNRFPLFRFNLRVRRVYKLLKQFNTQTEKVSREVQTEFNVNEGLLDLLKEGYYIRRKVKPVLGSGGARST